MTLPLAKLRVLALTQVGAGPYGMRMLADLGAEMLKIEDPSVGGDESRNVPPFAEGGDSLYFQSFNRNVRSLTIDLRAAEGRALFHRLVTVCDAVYANTRGDLPAKLGIDYASLKEFNPRIVCCSLSGFGRSGPRAADPAYDYLLQGLAGFMSVTGDPNGPPTRCGIPVVDYAGGLMSALGLLVALLRARETGVGGDVDVSLLDTAVSMLNYLATWNLNRGIEPERLADSAHPTLVPVQSFLTRDGSIVVMCMKEKFWQRLVDLLGLAPLAKDPRFLTFADRLAHREELIAILAGAMRARTTAEWLELLGGQVPCAPVNRIGEALRDEQVLARDMVIQFDHPRFGTVRDVGCPIKIDGVEPTFRAAPALGADTEPVLRELLGMSGDEIARVRTTGAIG
jgi:crotonobetainyl-CoA:carnitine CoA-transferase CaiB-like acyl-CoA transferase